MKRRQSFFGNASDGDIEKFTFGAFFINDMKEVMGLSIVWPIFFLSLKDRKSFNPLNGISEFESFTEWLKSHFEYFEFQIK